MSTALAAADRLALSRERLRQGLRASAAPHAGAAGYGSTPAWLDSLKHLPGVPILVDALAVWWKRQPLRGAVLVVTDVGNAALRPMAQRHPLRLVFGAMFVGALLGRSRPWRWFIRPSPLTGLGPLRRLLSMRFDAD